MNYFIKREDKEYGPYTLADLQRYVTSGNILMTELARSEGMSEWIAVSQIIGNIPVPAPVASVRPPDPMPLRNRNTLVVPRGVTLPHYCVKCAQPAEEPEQEKNFAWCPPALALLILLGLIGMVAYAIIYSVTKKQMSVNLPLCSEHKTAKRKKTWLGALLLALSPAFIVIAATADNGWYMLPFFAMLLAGVIVLARVSPIRPKKIDDVQGVFVGAGEPFLQMIEAQNTRAASAGYGLY